jgi:hypothetical protein
MNTLLRWWLQSCITVLGLAGAAFFGFYQYLWNTDVTKLSMFTLGLFVVISIFIGMLTYHGRDGDTYAVKRHLPFCWFMSELMMGLGMMGTLIGFLVLLQSAFGGAVNLNDAASTQKVLSGMAKGFGTAGVTTLVGLGASLLTKLQLTNLEYLLEDDV